MLAVSPKVAVFLFDTLRGERLAWALLGAGVLLRLVMPHRMIEMGIGYQLARFAEELILPRYGAGTTTLHHGLFQVFGADHMTMIWAHKVIGCLTLPIACAVGVRLLAGLGQRGLAPLWAAALALTPMLVRSDITESNLVPVLLAVWVSLAAWHGARGPLRLIGTASAIAFAALSRPEMMVVAPGLWLLLERPWRCRGSDGRDAMVVVALLVTPIVFQALFIQEVVAWETAQASLHLRSSGLWDKLPQVLLSNGLLDPAISPLLTLVLGVAALFAFRPARWTRWALALGGLAWTYVYAVDLSLASIPRLHVVGLLAFSLLASATAAKVLELHQQIGVAVIGLWALSAAGGYATLWVPTNEDTQDALYDELADTLPRADPYVLAVVGRADAPDQPGHYTHRHIPIYRFRDGRVSDLGRIPNHLGGEATVYYFQGPGCYAQLNRALSEDSGILRACRAVHDTFELTPLWTRKVPSHGNPVHQHLLYYAEADTEFEVGLWRVEGLRAR